MELILDSAVIEEVEIASWGVLDGVTTNPTLIGGPNDNFERRFVPATICSGPMGAEVTGMSSPEMVKKASILNRNY